MLALYQSFKIRREFAVYYHIFFGYWVCKINCLAVKSLTGYLVRIAAVQAVAQERMTYVRKMHPYLVSSSGVKIDFQHGAVIVTADALPVRYSLFSIGGNTAFYDAVCSSFYR